MVCNSTLSCQTTGGGGGGNSLSVSFFCFCLFVFGPLAKQARGKAAFVSSSEALLFF